MMKIYAYDRWLSVNIKVRVCVRNRASKLLLSGYV